MSGNEIQFWFFGFFFPTRSEMSVPSSVIITSERLLDSSVEMADSAFTSSQGFEWMNLHISIINVISLR